MSHSGISQRRGFLKLAGAMGLSTLSGRLLAEVSDAITAPKVLPEHYMQLFTTLADLIIPQTDTPGAVSCQVPEQMRAFILKVYGQQHQADYFNKLEALSGWLNENGPAQWQQADATALSQTLIRLENHCYDDAPDSAVAAGYKETKELIVFHYYTSQPGATQTLQYDPIPGVYKGCEDLDDIGKTWATPNPY